MSDDALWIAMAVVAGLSLLGAVVTKWRFESNVGAGAFVVVAFLAGIWAFIEWNTQDDRKTLAELGADQTYFQVNTGAAMSDVGNMRGVSKADSEAAVKTIDSGKLSATIKQVKEFDDKAERRAFAAALATASKSTIVITPKK